MYVYTYIYIYILIHAYTHKHIPPSSPNCGIWEEQNSAAVKPRG